MSAAAAALLIALLVALVYGVLVVAQVSDVAAVTVRGMTRRRAWATASAAVAFASVVGAGWSRLLAPRDTPNTRRRSAGIAVAAGAIAALSGALNVAATTTTHRPPSASPTHCRRVGNGSVFASDARFTGAATGSRASKLTPGCGSHGSRTIRYC